MTFSKTETEVLTSLMDRIIPADKFPSASEAGVLNYITRLFETDMKSKLEWYAAGLRCLNTEAEVTFGSPFSQLPPHQQDEIITAMLSGSEKSAWEVPPPAFVQMTINIVSEGYYADPGNGGNKDCVSWKMIGFEVIEGVRLPVESEI